MIPGSWEQRRLAKRGYDSCVIRVEVNLDVVGGWGHVVDVKTEDDNWNQSTLIQSSPQVATRGPGGLEGPFEPTTPEVWGYCMGYVRRYV